MIWLRFQYGPKIGMGHAVRCLNLARALKAKGQEVGLLLDSSAPRLAGAEDWPVIEMDKLTDFPEDGAIIFDISHAETRDSLPLWIKALSKAGRKTGVIDGLGLDAWNGRIKPDLVLTPYLMPANVLARSAKAWISGPQYAILSEAYAEEPPALNSRKNSVLISIGGADPWALTETALEAALSASSIPRFDVRVVAGPQLSAPRRAHLTTQCKKTDVELLDAPPSLHDLLCASAVAVLGPGLTKYEAAACNTPAVILAPDEEALALNQPFAESGLANVMDASARNFAGQLSAAIASQASKRRSSWTGRSIIDGKGSARAADAILEALVE